MSVLEIIFGAAWLTGAGIACLFFLAVYVTAKRQEKHARREALRVARGHGKVSGRVLRQTGSKCPNGWPSTDPDLDEFNKGTVEGWHEADREIREAERWVVDEAERFTRDAAA
jgi:hypothetical protein